MRSGSGIRSNRVRRLATTLATVGVLLVSSGIALMATSMTATAVPHDNSGVCSPLDSTKIDVTEQVTSLEVFAPDGKLIDGFCVKAGSENQGDGPRYVTVDPPRQSVTLDYVSDGKAKDISHYSLSYTEVVEPPVVEPPVVEPPVVEPPVVEPPVVEPPVVEPSSETVTPTVVNAGLDVAAGDTRDQQGLALVVAGALMLAGACGLVLTRARVSSVR
jgi:hypothetical protein